MPNLGKSKFVCLPGMRWLRIAAPAALMFGAFPQTSGNKNGAQGPHPHQGMSKPYTPGNPGINLSGKQLSQLEEGDMVQDQLKVAGGGRAIAVQDVHAPPEYVWDRILDFPAYPKMVPKVAACYNYFTQTLRNNTQVIKTRLKLNVFGVKFDNFIYHTYYPSLDSMTWTLDYSRRSTLDDSVGFWYIVPHPQREIKPDWTRVYYSCQLGIPSWVPGIVIGYLNKKAIKEANSWVKKESEALYSKDLASGKMSLQGKKNVLEPPSWLSKGLFSKDGAAERPAWLSKGLFGKALPPPPPVAVEPERGPPGGGVARAAKIGLGAGSCYLAWRLLQQDSDR